MQAHTKKPGFYDQGTLTVKVKKPGVCYSARLPLDFYL